MRLIYPTCPVVSGVCAPACACEHTEMYSAKAWEHAARPWKAGNGVYLLPAICRAWTLKLDSTPGRILRDSRAVGCARPCSLMEACGH